MKNEKAQYYLMAAAIIIAILLGISVLTNYITIRKKPVKIYDLSEELKEEAIRVVNYGVYTNMDTNELMENFTQEFIKYAEGKKADINFLFVYGNESGVRIVVYTNETLSNGRMSYETLFEDSEADYLCDGQTISYFNLANQNVLLKDCTVTGIGDAVQANGGNLKIISSNIAGNILAKEGTNIELVDSTVGGKVEGRLGGDMFIINNVIGNKIFIKDEGGTLFIVDNIISGTLDFPCSVIYQFENNDFTGGIQCIEKVKNNVKVEFLDNTYNLNLDNKNNFFFVISKESGGEVYVAKGEL